MGAGVLLVVLLIAGMIVLVFVLAREHVQLDRRAVAEATSAVARRLRQRYQPEDRSITWMVRGREAVLKDGAVTVDLRGHSPGTLKIVSEPQGHELSPLYEGQDLEVGDRSFDARFVVRASPASLAWAVFSPERRSRLIASVMRVAAFGPPTVDLSKERLRVVLGAATVTERSLQALVETATDWVEALLEVETTAEVHWIDEGPPAGGLCQVCGSEMTSDVVHCASCRTPHHEECWRWTGECSTFACKETRYVADGRTVSPSPRRQKPDDWLREELERDRRETGGAVEESIRRFERRQQERRGR